MTTLAFSFDVPDDKAGEIMDILLNEVAFFDTDNMSIDEKMAKLKEIRVARVKKALIDRAVKTGTATIQAQAQAAVDAIQIS